jgi:hypothetical protein
MGSQGEAFREEKMNDTWKRCNVCKREIPFEGTYYVCSVSTCNLKRTGLVFCSVECWDAHLPDARHRGDAGAVEENAPSSAQAARTAQDRPEPARPASPPDPGRAVSGPAREPVPVFPAGPDMEDTEILVIASRVKKYIRDKSGMNTSASTLEALTRCITALCDRGIENAGADERKTVMDRDIPRLRF